MRAPKAPKVPADDERVVYARSVVKTGLDPLGRYPAKDHRRVRAVWAFWFIPTERGIEVTMGRTAAKRERPKLAEELPEGVKKFLNLVPGTRVLADYQSGVVDDPRAAFTRAGHCLLRWCEMPCEYLIPLSEGNVEMGRRVLARRHIGEMGHRTESMPKLVTLTMTEAEYLSRRARGEGICRACGTWAPARPEARMLSCDACGRQLLNGVEELLYRGVIHIEET